METYQEYQARTFLLNNWDVHGNYGMLYDFKPYTQSIAETLV